MNNFTCWGCDIKDVQPVIIKNANLIELTCPRCHSSIIIGEGSPLLEGPLTAESFLKKAWDKIK